MILGFILLGAFIAGIIIGIFQKPDPVKQARWMEGYEAKLNRRADAKGKAGGDPRAAIIAAAGGGMMHR